MRVGKRRKTKKEKYILYICIYVCVYGFAYIVCTAMLYIYTQPLGIEYRIQNTEFRGIDKYTCYIYYIYYVTGYVCVCACMCVRVGYVCMYVCGGEDGANDEVEGVESEMSKYLARYVYVYVYPYPYPYGYSCKFIMKHTDG